MSYIEIGDKSQCSGCFACYQKCPKKCIEMEFDNEGFIYPKVSKENCINCGLCTKVCPIENSNKFGNEFSQPIALGGWNNNLDIKMKSSSGGVFSTIAEFVINKGGVVFGVAFDENFQTKHIMVDDNIKLEEIRGSKYVQSMVGDTYIQTKAEIEKGRVVLYVGTPCQIAGLYAFLDRKYDSLITIDIICHGVPSTKVYKDYLNALKQNYDSDISYLNFRDKQNGWNLGISMNVKFKNSNEYSRPGYEDNFIKGFLRDLYLRPSCYECKFAKVPRIADISLGDFWGVSNYYPELFDDKGTSLVLINNQHGKDIIEKCIDKIMLKDVDLKLPLKHNPSIASPVNYNPERKKFFRDYNKKGWRYVEKKYLAEPSLIKKVILRFHSYYKKYIKQLLLSILVVKKI